MTTQSLVPGPGPVPAASPVRASDAEREDTVLLLHRALGEGRLDLPEAETRVAAAYAAVHRHELPALLEDLPGTESEALPTGAHAPTWRALWTALVWRARTSLGDGHDVPPGAGAQRTAGLVIGLATLWFLVCVVAGAVL
jgi:hypothetical protein